MCAEGSELVELCRQPGCLYGTVLVRVSRPLPCESPGTFQPPGSSLNEQKDSDRFVPVLGHLKNTKHIQVRISLKCSVNWHGLRNYLLKINSKSKNFVLWIVIFVSGSIRYRCSTAVVVT